LIDTLKNQVRLKSVSDTERVLLISTLAAILAYVRPDSAIMYAQEGINLSRKIGFFKGEMYCKKSIGEAMWIVGEYSKANELLLEVLKYAKSINDVGWQVNAYRILSANNRDQENYEEALTYAYKSIELAKSNKQLQVQELPLTYLEAGADFQEMNKSDSALYYLQRVNLPSDANSGYTGFKFLMIGRTYAKMGNDALALKYYMSSINSLAGTNNYKDVAIAYNNIAKLYQGEDNIDSCIYYAKRGFDVAQNGTFKKGVFESSFLLSEIYETNNPRLSLSYFKKAMAAKDSMFNLQKTTQFLNAQFNEQLRQQQEEADKISFRNKIRTYILLSALGIFLFIALLLYRNNRLKHKAKLEIEKAYKNLESTQAQLIQSEKMASLGELTAGIAHEIQNPLNFVNNFSEVNTELIDELEHEAEKGNVDEVKIIAKDIKENSEKINHHGKRADAIVKGMLQHSQTSTGKKELTDFNKLADEFLRLSNQAIRAKDKSFNATLKTDFDESIGKINVIHQDIGRVLLNLYNNAFYTVSERNKQQGENYEPTISVSTKKSGDKVLLTVKDNGNGIPQKIVDKIFQPFFTTKPTGQGTGLGLSLAYDVIKAHGGEIKVESKVGEGVEFIVQIPIV